MNHGLRVRFTPEQMITLRQWAKAERHPMSGIVRDVIDSAIAATAAEQATIAELSPSDDEAVRIELMSPAE